MADKSTGPDYRMRDELALSSPMQVQAVSHALRTTILGLLHERAASVSEVATAVGKPRSTVAYHMDILQNAGLVRVVRTRRVRAIEERYFGRTARMFSIGLGRRDRGEVLPLDVNDLDVAADESQSAYEAHRLWSYIRHARIPPERAAEFWTRAVELVNEFDRLPRSGTTAYGFVLGIYPIPDYPLLPEREESDPVP